MTQKSRANENDSSKAPDPGRDAAGGAADITDRSLARTVTTRCRHSGPNTAGGGKRSHPAGDISESRIRLRAPTGRVTGDGSRTPLV